MISGLNETSAIATFPTPSSVPLSVIQTYVGCYATGQSFYVSDPTNPTETGDFSELPDTLEVVVAPVIGPVPDTTRYHVTIDTNLNTTGIRALEGSSPMFEVNSFASGDLIYFMPRSTL